MLIGGYEHAYVTALQRLCMLFGSSGIRAHYDRDLLWTAFQMGSALARTSSRVLVGRDPRGTGPVLEEAIVAGLLASGSDVFRAGIAPTPSMPRARDHSPSRKH
jgi:phosphoglucosamine mutase